MACFAHIPSEATVLDPGCGAGLDSLIAAKRVGSRGRVIGVDFSSAMLDRAQCAAAGCGMDNLRFCQADAGTLPIATGSIDIAPVNGIFNLNHEQEAIFRELERVVRNGGAAYVAELIPKEPVPAQIRNDGSNWFA